MSTTPGSPAAPRDVAPRVVVVGGGISGVAAAAEVRRLRPDVEVVLLEASPTLGGKLARAEVAGIGVDVGAESMLNRRPEAVSLAREVGLADRLVHPAATKAQLWSRGRLHPMPRTLMGVPTETRSLAGVLSPAGVARAAAERLQPATRLGDRDVSIGMLVEERFGSEVVDRLVEPLLGGVYAGHAREISARAAVPQVVALLDRGRSMMRSAAAAVAAGPSDVPVFAGLVGGIAALPQAVAAHAGLDVRTGATVRELERTPTRWRLVLGSTHDPAVLQADAVVLATPARASARLLADVAPVAARQLGLVDYASMAVVTLAFRTADWPATQGSGFLVPPVDGRDVKAATYSSAKWDWVREAGRADDVLLVRCSLGRHREESVLQRTDEELVAVALADLADAVGVLGRPVDAHVRRWGGALPQYAVEHLDRVRRVRAAVAAQPGLAVCGAALDGVGIPACIASATMAATQVVAGLPRPGTLVS